MSVGLLLYVSNVGDSKKQFLPYVSGKHLECVLKVLFCVTVVVELLALPLVAFSSPMYLNCI